MRVRNVTVSFLGAVTMLMAETAQERLKEATEVFSEIMGTPEKGVPEELTDPSPEGERPIQQPHQTAKG